jgi:hypothetical protein
MHPIGVPKDKQWLKQKTYRKKTSKYNEKTQTPRSQSLDKPKKYQYKGNQT